VGQCSDEQNYQTDGGADDDGTLFEVPSAVDSITRLVSLDGTNKQAMGNMMSKAQMQIFADPDTMARMANQFMRAASLGTAADGLMKSLPPQSQELLGKLASSVASQLSPKAAAAVAEHANGNTEKTVEATSPVKRA
jgi:hypothetical protein